MKIPIIARASAILMALLPTVEAGAAPKEPLTMVGAVPSQLQPGDTLIVSGSSAATDGLLAITDGVNGTVTGSLRPDSVFVNRTYNGRQASTGHDSAGDALHPFIAYGTMVAASGSVALLGGNINVYNSTNGPAGRSEFTPLSVAVVPMKGGSFAAGSNYYNDFNIQSGIGSDGQEGFLASGSFAVQKWTSGNIIDSRHAGSYGLSVVTTPANTGYDSQNHAADTTYPLNAMIALNGWSGHQTNTAAGGQTTAATAAADIGLKIGGVGGSIWSCSTCQSYIPTGIDISDYTTAAIHVGRPNSGHSPSGTAIKVDASAGNLVIGDSIYAGTPTSGGMVSGRALLANALNRTEPALLKFQDQGTDKWLIGKQTDNSLSMYDSGRSREFLSVSRSGLVSVGEDKGVRLNPTTFSALPACSVGTDGVVAYITDASKAVTTWNQTVTAGGGANKAFIACNGTDWVAWAH